MIDHINAFAIVVDDVRKCAEFYRDKLGFKEMELSDDFAYLKFSEAPGPGLALISRKGFKEDLEANEDAKQIANTSKSYFATFLKHSADEEYDNLKDRGVSFVTGLSERPNGQRYAFFKDPEGNLWEISHFQE